MTNNARAASRTHLHYPATVTLADQTSISGRTVDLSLGGVCLLTAAPVAAQSCSVSVELPREHGAKLVQANGQVIYSDMQGGGFRTGIQFTRLDPAHAQLIARLLIS